MATFFMPENVHPVVRGFIDYIKFEKRYSPHTVRAYTDDLVVFLDFVKAQFDVEAPDLVSTTYIRTWMAALTLQKVQPRSINRKISSLNSFYRYCMVQGFVPANPVKGIQVLKTRKRLPSYIEKEQMELLLQGNYFTDDFAGKRDRLILSILYHTGIRVSELVGLKTQQFEVSRGQLKVLGKGNKERIIPVHKELISLVEVYLSEKQQQFPDSQGPYLLVGAKGGPVTARWVYDIVKKYLSFVTTAEKESPHVLRHSFATHLTGNGAELNAVKELLGHSSLAATQVYTHNSIERLRDIHKKAHPKG
jgi:integrase/recombinase XerC